MPPRIGGHAAAPPIGRATPVQMLDFPHCDTP
jgi:hypothetical protein